jgi:TRAP-type C4-dicarboxylate transport system permease small subunit
MKVKFLKWLNEHLEETILVVLLVVINFVMLAQIIARYIFNDSMSWPEEFCRYCYVWTVFLSISYTIAKGSMLRVSVVMDLFPAKIQSTIRVLCDLIMLALFWVFFRHAVSVVGHIKNVTHEISSAMRIPMWIVYMSVLAG